MAVRMPRVPPVFNPDERTISIRPVQTTAIRIDDNDIAVRKSWSSAKINSLIIGISRVEMHTTAEWNADKMYIPTKGTLCIYTDRRVIDNVKYLGMKIADGKSYVIDLPFLDDDITMEMIAYTDAHIENNTVHISEEEREFWNNKLNCEISEDENLIFTRL